METVHRFRCSVCPSSFVTNSEQRRHALIHTGEKPFACYVCSKRFNRKYNMKVHAKTHAGGADGRVSPYRYPCSVCDESFPTDDLLNAHVMSSHRDKPLSYVCGVCFRTFRRGYDLKVHARAHTGERPYACGVCAKKFGRVNVLRVHERIHDKKEFRCVTCREQFVGRSELRSHVQRCHNVANASAVPPSQSVESDGEPRANTAGHQAFDCDFGRFLDVGKGPTATMSSSSAVTSRRRQQQQQQQQLLSEGAPEEFGPVAADPGGTQGSASEARQGLADDEDGDKHSCDVCNKSYPYKKWLRFHRKIDDDEIPYSCDVCPAQFTARCVYLQHRRTHAGQRPYPCDVCRRRFVTESALREHAEIHARAKKYACPTCCRKSYTTYRNLLVHMRSNHTGYRPYTCELCPEAYVQLSALNAHMKRTHPGENPYVCQLCFKVFTCNSNLVKHLRAHTGVKPYTCEHCRRSFSLKGNYLKHLCF